MAAKSSLLEVGEEREAKRRKLDKNEGIEEQESDSKRNSLLRETDVGITEWIDPDCHFSGVIKQRYSDFLVNEIALDGKLVCLTSKTVPDELIMTMSEQTEHHLSEETQQQLEKVASGETENATIKTSHDKEERGRMHRAIKAAFPNLESNTLQNDDGEKLIQVVKPKKVTGRRQASPWPSDRGDYCQFVLYKEYKDTADAISLITKYLNVKPKLFTFAGSKDKRAVTVQAVSAYKVPAQSLANLNSKLRNIALGNFSYSASPMKLGDLVGNRFQIILRNVSGEKAMVESSLESLQSKGFINYFGMQRFGTYSVPTYQIGKALLDSKWNEAIKLILDPRIDDNPEIAKARVLWSETQNPGKCLRKMPKQCTVEIQLLKGIQRCGLKDALNCLQFIPRNTRLMYVHSYQSLIWNRIVSRRLREFELNVVVGDLIQHPDGSIKPLTAEEQLSLYSIYDVVMPLPGHDIQLPQNQTKDWYDTMLKDDGFSLATLKHKVKDYSLPGSYRHLLVKPLDMTWDCMTYNDVMVPLLETDVQKLNGTFSCEPVEDGLFKAAKLAFSLPSSSYATMALRELTKTDTSAAFQTTLNT
eukprot:m.53784 g.53784  ORF g.53784 m.53784 type:complete len:587 (+) comp34278_c0_seq6:340-2100(+)